MTNFEYAINYVLKHEGGFVNDPKDLGGITNYGISARFLHSINKPHDHDTIYNMKKDEAIGIYKEYFWRPNRYKEISSNMISTKIFDMCVNMGSKKANTLAQRALRSQGIIIADDGIIGRNSIDSFNRVFINDTVRSFITALMTESACYYRSLNQSRFINGWLNRAYDQEIFEL